MAKEHLFKISFYQKDALYEIYARQVSESDMYGFIVVEELVFSGRSQVVIDPGEEKVKAEFANVIRTYIPMHAVLRIDEVEYAEVATIVKKSANVGNVSSFPGVIPPSSQGEETG